MRTNGPSKTPSPRAARWPVIAAAAPLLALLLGDLGVVAGWAAGWHPFWPTPPVTLSEAVGMLDMGETYRLVVYERHDPNAAWPVRAGVITGQAETITPIEAAVAMRGTEMVRLLLRLGATPDPPLRAALICRAVQSGTPDIVDLLLATADRSDPRPACARP